MPMIFFFTSISVAAGVVGLYWLLGTEWKNLSAYERADKVLACTLLAIISVLALAASFTGPFM